MAFHALNRNRKSDIGNALHDIYEEDIAGWANRFELVAAMIGYEARPWTGCTIGELSVIVARCVDVLSEGVIGRTRVQGAVSSYEITTDGEKDRWSLLAIGVWCVVDFLAEPNRSAD